MKKKESKKKYRVRLVLDGKERLATITDNFYSNYRVINEFASMCIEEFTNGTIFDKDGEGSLEKTFQNISRLSQTSEMEKQYLKAHKKYETKLIKLFEKTFEVVIDRKKFDEQSFVTDEDDMKNNIVAKIEATTKPVKRGISDFVTINFNFL